MAGLVAPVKEADAVLGFLHGRRMPIRWSSRCRSCRGGWRRWSRRSTAIASGCTSTIPRSTPAHRRRWATCGASSTSSGCCSPAASTSRIRLARELAATASEDPFAGIVAGYVLLRLGRHQALDELASAVIALLRRSSDAYILRGEYEACDGPAQAAGAGIRQRGQLRNPGVRRGPDATPRGVAVDRLGPPARRARPAHLPTPRARLDVGRVHAPPRTRARPTRDQCRGPRLRGLAT